MWGTSIPAPCSESLVARYIWQQCSHPGCRLSEHFVPKPQQAARCKNTHCVEKVRVTKTDYHTRYRCTTSAAGSHSNRSSRSVPIHILQLKRRVHCSWAECSYEWRCGCHLAEHVPVSSNKPLPPHSSKSPPLEQLQAQRAHFTNSGA